jgi:hypothetical protein
MQIELATAPGGTHHAKIKPFTPPETICVRLPQKVNFGPSLTHTRESAKLREQRAKSVSIEILLGLHELNTTEPRVYHNGRLRER